MLGTIVNSIAILLGGFVGLVIKGGMSDRFKIIVTNAIGLSVLFIGISGAVASLTAPNANPILFIISLVIGGVIGEFINIDGKLLQLGDYLEKRMSVSGSSISKGFVSASLLFCVGTMAILGSLESGVKGVHNTLFAKSVLDGVSSIMLASSFGTGVLLSAMSVFVYQGVLTLLAGFISPYLTNDMIREISIVGGILITGLGLDLLEIKSIKVANLLPGAFIPVIYYAVIELI